MDAKALKNLTKDYQKTFKKDPKALVALGELLLLNKQFDEATNIANDVLAKNKNYGDAYILLGDVAAMKDDAATDALCGAARRGQQQGEPTAQLAFG